MMLLAQDRNLNFPWMETVNGKYLDQYYQIIIGTIDLHAFHG